MTRPDPRTFGRRRTPLTEAQLKARFAAVVFFGLALAAFGASYHVKSTGGTVLVTVLSFVALMAATVAAGEA